MTKYLNDNNLDTEKFIHLLASNKENRKLYNIDEVNRIKLSSFLQILANNIFPESQKLLVLTHGGIIDLDKDGYVDFFDFDTFLNRYHYLDENEIKKVLDNYNSVNFNRSCVNS